MKDSPNKWDYSVAGHISAGENSLQALLKECSEEIGVKIDPKNIEFLFNTKRQVVLNNGTHIINHFNDIYLITMDLDSTKIRIQPEEVAETRFVHYKELEKMIKNKTLDFVEHEEEYAKFFALLHQRYNQS